MPAPLLRVLRPLLPLLALAGCAPPSPDSGLSTPIPGWTDDQGRTVYYRGMNVASTAKYTDDNLPGFDDAAYDLLPAYGMTLVRYLVFWQAIEPIEGEYDDAYLDAVAADIQRLRDRDIDVMLDFHQDVWGEGFGFTGFPSWTCDQAQYDTFTLNTTAWALNYLAPEVQYCFDNFWASQPLQDAYSAMASHTAARLGDLVIGYDTMNEPYWGTSGQEELETGAFGDFQAEVAESLRAADPDAWIALEPLAYTNLTGHTYLPLPEDADHDPASPGGLLYAPHFYPTYAESGEGWDGDFTAEAAWLDGLADDADVRGVGLWLGEFGIFAENGNEAEYVQSVIDALVSGSPGRGGSTTYWAFDPGQIFDGATNEPAELLAAWQRPYFHAIPGLVVSMTVEGANSSIAYAPTLPGVALEIVLPEGSCVTLTVSAQPSMTGMGNFTQGAQPARVQLYGDATGEQVVTLECGQ